MTPPKQPKYSFLIDSLNLSPDAFFDRMKEKYDQKSFEKWGKMMEKSIKELTEQSVKVQEMRHYNDEVVKSWSEYVIDQEWKIPGFNDRSIFNFIRNFAKDCLRVQNGEVYFQVEHLDDWQPVSFGCGEDLFVAALLADMNHDSGYEPKDFQWDYILKSDFFLLNNLISQHKIVENHYHLGGSAPYVDLSWIYLMNKPFGQTERWEKFKDKSEESMYVESHSLRESHQSDMENLVKAAAYLRVKLFECCVLGDESGIRQDAIGDIDKLLKGVGVLQEDELQPKIETYLYRSSCVRFGTKVDYAIKRFQVFEDEKNNYITGERYLNYRCLHYIYGHPKNSFVQVLYYLYLLIRHHFNKEFIQANNKTGFQNFKEYNDRKSELIKGTSYERMAVNIAIEGNIKENYLEQLEVRVKPEEKAEKLRGTIDQDDGNAFFRSSRIKLLDRVFPNGKEEKEPRKYADGTEEFFYVLHFIKKREPSWFSKDKDCIEIKNKSYGEGKYSVVRQCREFDQREIYRKQAETLKEMRDRNEEVCKRIFGIDAASNEVNFRPENFGTVFRYLSSSKISQDVPWKRKIPDLRKTYHVGEDFYDVVDGLRAIDEAILYLELSQGDRIGHAVALGIDVEKWYKRHSTISLPKQNLLDNIAWMSYEIREFKIEVSAYYGDSLKTLFEKLYIEIYEECSPGLMAYMEAWKLRGDDPQCYSSITPDKDNLKGFSAWDKACIRDKKHYRDIIKSQESIKRGSTQNTDDKQKKVDLVYNIYHRYHFDEELKRRAAERMEYVFDEEYIAIVKQLQLKMRSYVTEKGIAIESCPSSNFLISNLDTFEEIPTFQLFPLRESHNPFRRLNVCVNTDDQGVFYTSLVKEYTLLMATKWKELEDDDMREHSDDKILIWIKRLIENSKQLCFRTGDVRNFGIRSDDNLFEIRREKPLDDHYVLPCVIL